MRSYVTTVNDLRTNTRTEPLGIGTAAPEFAWKLVEPVAQTAYQLQVFAGEELVWDSGRVESDQPFGVVYAGAALTSCRRYTWRVRVAGGDELGPWAESSFETGVLDPASWQADWIAGPDEQVLYLRGNADLPAEVVRGRAYVSALGWYRFFVNGVDLTGPALVPRWTPLDSYVEYQAYDVTEAFRAGGNVLAMAVGDGRYRGRNGIMNSSAVYGDRLAGFAQVHLELSDGSNVVVTTDGSWRAGTGRIETADPKFGERADLRIPDEDWLGAQTAPARFGPVQVRAEDRTLVAEEVGRVQQIERIPAQSVTRTVSGKQIVDFGQNLAGVVRIRLRGPSGMTVRIMHSEVLGTSGELDLDYLHATSFGRWFQRDEVILSGEETWWNPWFTIHGFRYCEVDGLPDDLKLSDVECVVLSSDLPGSGDFSCSDPRLVRLHENVRWSVRSNFVDTPTDCPTRERSGWTGDIQAFGPAATIFVDAQAYLRRYLRNLAAEQLPDGRVPVFIPSESSEFSGGMSRATRTIAGSVGWGDAAVLLPWTLHQYYGDRAVLAQLYRTMTAWVDQLAGRARDGHRPGRRREHVLDTGFHFGEWLRPGEGPGKAVLDGMLRSPVVATAYLEHSARTLSTIAETLGHDADSARYRELAEATRSEWRTEFLHPDGTIGTDRQDDYVRALAFDLLDPGERPAAVQRLVRLIERAGDHLGTGFLSTPMLLPVLVDGGRADVAWRLLMQTTSPSWLHQVERGATTVWETWEGYTSDGKPTASHNHYAFGAVAGFLTERVAGLAPAEPGYRVIEVRPLIGGGLTWARASVQTPYGRAASFWRRDGNTIELEITVPPGASARVHADSIQEAGPGTHTFRWTAGEGVRQVSHGIEPSDRSRRDEATLLLGGKLLKGIARVPAPLRNWIVQRGRAHRPPEKFVRDIPLDRSKPGGVPTMWLGRERRKTGTIVYLHGGAYVFGPASMQWAWLAEMHRRTGLAGAGVLYGMPPERPQPAALNDAIGAITAMHSSGELTEGRWILAGDSAGGGLALAVAHALRDSGGPDPAGLLLTAPWIDLEMAGSESAEAASQDPMLSRAAVEWAAELYADGLDRADPTLSPINGSMAGLPPVHLNVGTRDALLLDVRKLRDALAAAGVPVDYIEQEGAIHTYPQLIRPPEAQWALRCQTRWIGDLLASATEAPAVRW